MTPEPKPISLARARQINRELTGCAFDAMLPGLQPDDRPRATLPDIPLADLLEATRIARDAPNERNAEGHEVIVSVCDDRLTAALYVLHHYDPDNRAIVQNDRVGVAVLPLRGPS